MNNQYDSTINNIPGNVLVNGDVIFSCELIQQNIQMGTNKFYLMQIVDTGINEKYHLCVRYGRIGEYGTPLNKSYNSMDEVIKAFCKQYKAKTKNTWGSGEPFIQHRGLYASQT
jgi:poly [ADP-ribose] polymerase 2/3/4